MPAEGALDLTGLDADPADVAAALAVEPAEWREELPLIEAWFDRFGDRLPAVLWTELDALRLRLGG